MQRLLKALPIVLVAVAVCPAVANARTVIVGQTKTKLVAPSCPKGTPPLDCTIVLHGSTALPSVSDGIQYPTTIDFNGKVKAFTIGMSNLSPNAATRKTYVKDLNNEYGGQPEARLTVLRPVGRAAALSYRVVVQSGVWNLESDLGRVKKLNLKTALPVVKGDVLALTVPTWAAVLPLAGNAKQNAYRQAKSTKCSVANWTTNINVQSTVGEFAKYGCSYGTRPQFTAGETTS